MLHFTLSCRTCAYGTPVLRPQFVRTCSALVLWTAQIRNADHQGLRRCWTLQHSDHYDQKRVCLQTYRGLLRCQWHRMHCAYGVIDTACIWFSLFEVVHTFFVTCGVNYTTCTKHAVLMTPHAPCMRYQWYRYRMHFKKFEYVRKFGAHTKRLRTKHLLDKTSPYKMSS
jgi:hypothetical protein